MLRTPSFAWHRLIALFHGIVGAVYAQPDNDSLERAAHLSGEHVRTEAYFLGATRDPGDPVVLEGPTVWYQWTAPSDGFLRLGAEGWSYPGAYLFTGTNQASLTYQAPFVAGTGKTHDVSKNQTYLIGVVSPALNPDGTIAPVRIELDFTTTAANDQFANRVSISGEMVEARGWTAGAIQQDGEPFRALWWTWTAPANGLAKIAFVQPIAGDGLAVFRGNSLETLTPVWQSPHPQTIGEFQVGEGSEYHISVSSSTHEGIAFEISLEYFLTPQGLTPNQIFRQGKPLTVSFSDVMPGDVITNMLVYVNNWGVLLETNKLDSLRLAFLSPGTHQLSAKAEAEGGRRYVLPGIEFHVLHPSEMFQELPMITSSAAEVEADLRGSPALSDTVLWWRWKAPRSGVVHGEKLSGEDLAWSLWKGTNGSALEPVTDWTMQAGQDYVLQVSAFRGFGRYRFTILPVPPTNDAFANALVLNGEDIWEPVRIDTATPDAGEPAGEGGPILPSIWYLFTPASDGVITFGAGEGQLYLAPQLWPNSVFKDGSIDALEPVAPLDGAVQFVVKAGQRYRLRLQKAFQDGRFPYVYFSFGPKAVNDQMADATLLAGDHVTFELALEGASSETNEPLNYVAGIPIRSIWFRWQAPYDGFAAFRAPELPIESWNLVGFALEVFQQDASGIMTNVPARLIEREGRFFEARQNATYFLRFSDYTGLGTNRYSAALDLTDLKLEALNGLVHAAPDGPSFMLAGTGASNVVSLSYRERTVEWDGGISRWTEWLEHTNATSASFTHTISNLAVGNHLIYAVATNVDGSVGYLPPLEAIIRPENDDFFSRQTIVGRGVSAEGTMVNATIEEGEPMIGNPPADTSVWYSWTAPVAAPTTISVFGENYVRIFEGETLSSLVPAVPNVAQVVNFTPIAGKTYQVAVASVSTNPAPMHWATFGLRIQMDVLTLLEPLPDTVFDSSSAIPISLFTPEIPEDVLITEIRASSETPGTGTTIILKENGLVTNTIWTNPSPGNYLVTAKLTLETGDTVGRSARIRIRPANNDFANATVLENAGMFRPSFIGADQEALRRSSVWYRYEAKTNGHLLISVTNRTSFSSVEIQVSVGTETNVLTAIPVIGRFGSGGWVAVAVNAGTNYNLRFIGETGSIFQMPLQYLVVPPAENDLFQNARSLTGEHFQIQSYTLFATNEPAEPPHFGGAAQRTLWWKWVSPARKGYVITSGRVKLYRGDTFEALEPMPATFYSTGETEYKIVHDGISGTFPQEWKLDFRASPLNDDFVNRAPLQGRRVLFQADLNYATSEEGEELVHPGGFNSGHTVWFTWTAPASGQAFLRKVPESQFGPVVAFRGTELTNLVWVEPDLNSRFAVQEGEQIHVSVDGNRPFTILEMILDEPPSNDRFDNALILSGAGTTAQSWNFGATREMGEPNHNSQFGGRSVWFTWTAIRDGRASVSVAGDVSTNIVAIYRGSTVTSLQPIVAQTAALTNQIEFSGVVGETYYIAVDGVFGAVGDFAISLASEGEPTAPSTINGARFSGGKLHFGFDPISGQLELERSEDLIQWERIQIIEPGGFELELLTEMPRAFFRLKRP